jgi:hypothetical protein
VSFSEVLSTAIEGDDGLILRVGAYEKMVEAREQSRGWPARLIDGLRRRSRKISSGSRTEGVASSEGRIERCH